MKSKIFALLLLAGFFAACTQTTCPTYTKENVKKIEKAEKSV